MRFQLYTDEHNWKQTGFSETYPLLKTSPEVSKGIIASVLCMMYSFLYSVGRTENNDCCTF